MVATKPSQLFPAENFCNTVTNSCLSSNTQIHLKNWWEISQKLSILGQSQRCRKLNIQTDTICRSYWENELNISISNADSPNQHDRISQPTSCCCILFWENAKGDEPHPTSRMPNSSSVHSSRDEIILESKSSSRDDHLQSNSVERAALLHISFLIFGTPTTF